MDNGRVGDADRATRSPTEAAKASSPSGEYPSRGASTFLRRWFRSLRRRACRHLNWQTYDGNTYKRRCSRCGLLQYLFERRYPDIGEAKYKWQDMGYADAPAVEGWTHP